MPLHDKHPFWNFCFCNTGYFEHIEGQCQSWRGSDKWCDSFSEGVEECHLLAKSKPWQKKLANTLYIQNTWQPEDLGAGLRWRWQRQMSRSRLHSRGQGDRPHPQHQPGAAKFVSDLCYLFLLFVGCYWKKRGLIAIDLCLTRTKGSTRRFLLLRLAVLVVSPAKIKL